MGQRSGVPIINCFYSATCSIHCIHPWTETQVDLSHQNHPLTRTGPSTVNWIHMHSNSLLTPFVSPFDWLNGFHGKKKKKRKKKGNVGNAGKIGNVGTCNAGNWGNAGTPLKMQCLCIPFMGYWKTPTPKKVLTSTLECSINTVYTQD